MENRLGKVHISYKHDSAYIDTIEAIKNGLTKNGIPFSIDEYDIMYRDSIDDYEKEIGLSEMVIMFVIPSYFRSLDCMFEMTRIFKAGNVADQVYPVVDMGGIARNGDGLKVVKDFWQKEKIRRVEQIRIEAGQSKFQIGELQKIDDIISSLDELWMFLCRCYTGSFEKLIENDAEMLVREIQKDVPADSYMIDVMSNPSSGDSHHSNKTIINQYGSKSVYIENNNGSINIS